MGSEEFRRELLASAERREEQEGKADGRNVRLAARLRKNTTMSLKWIAQRLAMGSWTHASNLLAAKRKQESLNSED